MAGSIAFKEYLCQLLRVILMKLIGMPLERAASSCRLVSFGESILERFHKEDEIAELLTKVQTGK